MKNIQKLELSTSFAGVKSFLVAINFYRRFIFEYLTLLEPLNELTNKKTKIKLTMYYNYPKKYNNVLYSSHFGLKFTLT